MLNKKLPVTVISGFLGAGKTTLVNHVLSQNADATIGVIVNEYGEVGIDGELIIADDNALIEIRNGCICCTVRSDLVAGVKTLLAREDIKLDRLIIETSGLADPAPVLQSFLADPDLLMKVELESVIAIVDAANLKRQIHDDIAREQIAFADLVILNKAELAEAGELEAIEGELRLLNPTAHVIRATKANVSFSDLLGTPRFSLPNLLQIEPELLEGEHDHEYDQSVSSCAVETEQALDPSLFNRWINQLVQREGASLLRMKGILQFKGEARPFQFHSVHMLMESKPARRWRPDEARKSRFVFIGRHLDAQALQQGFLACAQAATESVVA